MDIGDYLADVKAVLAKLSNFELDEKIELINQIRIEIKELSPFSDEPIDCVLWVKADLVAANDYNPNSVAPPEMELLKLSIEADGYTQPVVTWDGEEGYEVIDGFHRTRVCKEYEEVRNRVNGYLPIVVTNADREDRNDRIAATIRHNRARGKHKIDAMSDIVVELKKRNWSNVKIGKQLGMDADEVLRLTQITGLAEMFADKQFSEAWEAESLNEADYEGSYEQID